MELGDAPRLMHGGFGLLTIGNLRKPPYWALAILERLGEHELACEIAGDGAGGLVEAWASRRPDGRLAIALWNGTLDQSGVNGDARLDRVVRMRIDGLAGRHRLRHWRVDASHSNIASVWEQLDGHDWPDDQGWATLRRADRLEEFEPARSVEARAGGPLEVEFELPMPAVSLVEIHAS